ncbi:phosphoribosylamine--glycine ligase [Algicella marina]|uniref:Phosphoribosylamine--glycine ligase n=1 Tax=Algicella marina TaxID=2683284 RepID=A0A6P1SZP4_9RHOB|nr:phosphoribosylamine--glycine ligase [Algicella marina]QHQ34995.1 phosphoribosylamine--glycine ligase [Algicella marina]
MNILILGSGGREHSLAWAIAQNPKCDRLFVAPGNAGIAEMASCLPCDIEDGAAVVALAAEHNIDFVVIGPEAPLAAGVADDLREAGYLTFGPGRAAAQLEASKSFTKEICTACNAPTAAYRRFDDHNSAVEYMRQQDLPIVIKADGLAAGKGVTVVETMAAAETALAEIFGGAFGAAGAEVVIEAFLTGEEASFFVLSDGETAVPIGTAQDHKRALEGDKGPNTGGMGAYSPAPIMTDVVIDRTMEKIIRPTLTEMARRGTPFSGVLFAGLMIDDGNPSLVEYNTRFGDPECQTLMLRLGAQVLDLLLATAEGRLAEARPQWADDHALTVVLATNGYPGSYSKGSLISGLSDIIETPNTQVFHAGTSRDENGQLIASGGRVLAITARAETLSDAQDRAYEAVAKVDWPEGFFRRDIGWRALSK